MNVECEFVSAIGPRTTLGEGVLWNQIRRSVFWTDIEECSLYEYSLENEGLERYQLPHRLCSFGFTDDPKVLVAAFDHGLALYDFEHDRVEWISKLNGSGGVRYNDGRIDAVGRFWVGSMVESAEGPQAGLYCLDQDGELRQHLDNVSISNAICWSPDSRIMYFADSAAQEIRIYPFDVHNGSLGQAARFAITTGDIFPDGAVTDTQGYLWCANWGGSRVVRYAPDSTIDFELATPTSQPTCIAFGGDDLDVLFVSTASFGLDQRALSDQPLAGKLLVFKTNIKGLPSTNFQGTPDREASR